MKGSGGPKALLTGVWVALLAASGPAHAETAAAKPDAAAALHARYEMLKGKLGDNQFHRPLHMDSTESPEGVTGEIHALLDHPFATAGPALNKATQWCDILILHLNTKYCRPSTEGPVTIVQVRIGRKYDQPMDEAHRVDFVYRVAAETASYLQVRMDADEGPLGTRDYRIVLEAAPVQGGRTFIRLTYSYSYGRAGWLAMQAYLATLGRHKVGFTVVGRELDGQPRYVGGVRGVVERNTMRYYLAVEAFLGALSIPADARVEKSLSDWFAAVERHPRQLHDMERGEYLDMKRREYSRQQAQVPTSSPRPS